MSAGVGQAIAACLLQWCPMCWLPEWMFFFCHCVFFLHLAYLILLRSLVNRDVRLCVVRAVESAIALEASYLDCYSYRWI